MTAINPAKLKIQCADLSESYNSPERFVSGLHNLLGFYAARIRQTSLSKTPLTLQSYQVPTPVFRTLLSELEESLDDQPELGIKLIDTLWKEEWVEFRQLAITCLGTLSPTLSEEILNRIQTWLNSSTAEDIRKRIMVGGLTRLHYERSKTVFAFIGELIGSGTKMNCQAALFGLIAFADDPEFDNLPIIYKNLAKILVKEETSLVREITALVLSLAERSEQETAFFLERQLATAAKPRIFRIIRQVTGKFSKTNQELLRKALSNYQ